LDNDPIVKPDILADLQEGIPLEDNSVDEIRCHHILEHIETKYKVKVLGELWRVLKPGGILDIEVPNFPSEQSIQDPTHVSFWSSACFKYFIPGQSLHENFKTRYSQYPVPTFERISEELESGWIYRTKLKKV
jgi:ubiquinone/menaquinone biosynthesis C-methylase UbiE